MASKREREIAADNGMWLTHPSHLTIKKWGERGGGLSTNRDKIH